MIFLVGRAPFRPRPAGAALVVCAAVLLDATSASADSCSEDIGRRRAQILVDQCLEVSPATHPPCNAENSCALIRSEIERGCALLSGSDKPDYCED